MPIPHGIIHVTENAKIHSNLENSTTHCGPRSISPQLSNLTHSASLQERQSQEKENPPHSHGSSIFSSFPLAKSPPHFLFVADFLCILALHLAASGGTSVHTIAVAHLPPPLPSSSPLVFEDSTAAPSKNHGFYTNQPRESSQF